LSSYDIAKELNIDHETRHLRKTGYTKKLDVLILYDLTKKFNEPNFHLQIIAETKQN